MPIMAIKKEKKMKRIVSTLLVCVLLLGCVFSLTACSKILNGKYELDAVVGSKTYDFSLTKVTITYELLGKDTTIEGKYKIAENDDGDLEITFTFEDEEKAEDYAGTFSFAKGKEGDTEYIKIGGVKYTKVD